MTDEIPGVPANNAALMSCIWRHDCSFECVHPPPVKQTCADGFMTNTRALWSKLNISVDEHRFNPESTSDSEYVSPTLLKHRQTEGKLMLFSTLIWAASHKVFNMLKLNLTNLWWTSLSFYQRDMNAALMQSHSFMTNTSKTHFWTKTNIILIHLKCIFKQMFYKLTIQC